MLLQEETVFSMRHLMILLFLVVALAGVTASADVAAFDLGGGEENLIAAYSVLATSAAEPGDEYPAAVVADIVPGWHINSAKPYQDYLIPAEVEFDTLEGLVPSDIRYPDGKDATLAGERMSVYSDRAVILFNVTISSSLPGGEYRLPVRFTYQPCNDRECRAPSTADIPLKITVGSGGQPANQAIFSQAVSGGSSSDTQETPISKEEPRSELEELIATHGFWGYFLALGLAFVFGLVLSFSPCTYPMIPITVSIFAGQDRTVARGFFLSLVYVGTMAVVYGVMGLVVSLVGGVFGAWLASPPVVIGIVLIFIVFALSMFGLYDLNVPSALRQKLGTRRSGGGVLGSIVLGVVAALVVSPCVGPFVAGILLYIATSGSPVVGFLTLFVFALGLGTLFVVIGTFSSAIARLPRSGEWMESIKKFFGFVLLLMAVYFLRTLVSPVVTASITALLLLAFGVFGGGLDRLNPEAGFFLRLKKYVGLLAILVAAYLVLGILFSEGFILPAASTWLPMSGDASLREETGIRGWETDLDVALTRAKNEGKPVLIDTWATWCANCKVLEKKTFSNSEVGREAERFVPVKVQLEKEKSPQTVAFKTRFGLKTYSLPTTLLLDSQGNISKIITGVIGPDELISEMRKVR
jgi:thiol:disulfide interchange protein DsbD